MSATFSGKVNQRALRLKASAVTACASIYALRAGDGSGPTTWPQPSFQAHSPYWAQNVRHGRRGNRNGRNPASLPSRGHGACGAAGNCLKVIKNIAAHNARQITKQTLLEKPTAWRPMPSRRHITLSGPPSSLCSLARYVRRHSVRKSRGKCFAARDAW